MTNVELWEEYVQSLVVCASHQLPQFSNFRDLAVIKSNRTVASLISAASVWGLIHFAILPTQSQFNAITSKYKRSYRSCYFLQGAGFNMLRCPAFIDTFTALRGCHAETWSGKQHCVLPGRAAWTTTSTSFDGQKNAREARRKEKRAGWADVQAHAMKSKRAPERRKKRAGWSHYIATIQVFWAIASKSPVHHLEHISAISLVFLATNEMPTQIFTIYIYIYTVYTHVYTVYTRIYYILYIYICT